ncbi:hypothetical protein PPTG_20234 [Phytophthora nicotianae INRA-310]|uniref:Uncharacterized protein n=1 Tax=Phytophthora nicotianae (strain INRA-310) TaxID=761204 RepID=W2P9Q1_PHYN3|nr:hypothetical protein PPTG_20234 [Phytophthora nicotianae INRA-310]ETM97551.1 hypothetical protein PPTG_20234 [Phytophthora nicotianae INRA-310]
MSRSFSVIQIEFKGFVRDSCSCGMSSNNSIVLVPDRSSADIDVLRFALKKSVKVLFFHEVHQLNVSMRRHRYNFPSWKPIGIVLLETTTSFYSTVLGLCQRKFRVDIFRTTLLSTVRAGMPTTDLLQQEHWPL